MTTTVAIPALFYPAVEDEAIFDAEGPRPQFLVDTAQFKVLVAGLEPGQQIPVHPEAMAVYHFLSGDGTMQVDGQEYAVAPGATIVAPPGAARGMRAGSRLAFLAVKAGA